MEFKQGDDFIVYEYDNKLECLKGLILKSQPTEEEWKANINLLKTFYKLADNNNIKFSIIFDLRKLGILSYNYVNEWANLFLENKSLTEKLVYKSALITNNIIIKNAINAFFVLYKTVRPIKIVYNVQEALDFISE